jgi:hypothetical protein
MDLDFSDGRGYVIMPVATTVQLIDARTPAPLRAPAALEIEQVLDTRALDQTTAKLDIKATANGLIPALKDLVDLDAIARSGLKITKTDDHGLTVADLDTSGDSVTPKCERSWTLELATLGNAAAQTFTFPVLKPGFPEASKLANKRYTDADIAACPATVPIHIAAAGTPGWLPWIIGLAAVVVLGLVGWFIFGRKRHAPAALAPMFVVPERLTPVNAIATLQRIAAVPGLSLAETERRDLAVAIQEIEIKFFGPQNGHGEPKLDESTLRPVVERWIGLATGRASRA